MSEPSAQTRAAAPVEEPLPPRPFQVLAVTGNKGGIGKTTLAANLAVYLRALREDLPILLLGFDDQPMPDRMFALDASAPGQTVLEAMRAGSFADAIRLGQYGVHYVPSSPDVAELKREITSPFRLDEVLRRSGWSGLVIVDTKSDLEILTRNAIAASDLTLVLVEDHASLIEAEKVFDLLRQWERPAERARILISLVDLRIKYPEGEQRDALSLLLSEIRRRGHPLFQSFISRSPKVQALSTNPEGRAVSVLHGARGSTAHRQMLHVADDVLSALAEVAAAQPAPLPQAILRSDLIVSRQEDDRGLAFVVKDPTTGRFFRFGEVAHFIARGLDGRTPGDALCRQVEERFGAKFERKDLDGFVKTLRQRGLLEGEGGDEPERADRPHAPGRRLRGSLLYLRLKAFDPDRLFGRLVRPLRGFFSPAFVAGSAGLIGLALAVTLANGAEIGHALLGLYRFDALLLAWVTLLSVTALHELAHGLTCKRFGGAVPELGFMLLYFQPAMYCNVSDAWLFPERSKRLWVTFAGAYFEIFVWALATLLWRLTEAGTAPNSLALIVMATSGVKTLFNLNPLIKLDGYYLLSDALGIPNLRERAFRYLRAQLQRVWKPGRSDAAASSRERRIFLAYGLLAGAYSYFILGIIALWFGSVLVASYQAWGFLLFTGLLAFLLRRPIATALRGALGSLGMRSGRFAAMPRFALYGSLGIAALAALFAGHMQLTVPGEFVLLPAHNADVRAEIDGIIDEIYVREGDVVEVGDPIALLSDRDYRAELEHVGAAIAEKQAERRLLESGPTAEEAAVARAGVEKASQRLKYARSRLERVQRLHDQQLSSDTDVEAAQEQVAVRARELKEAEGRLRVHLAGSRVEEIEAVGAEIAQLEARRRLLEERLGQTRILAPVPGVVTTPRVHEKLGEYVEKGDLVVEVYEVESVIAEIRVSERDMSAVEVGQRVVLRSRAFADRPFEGTVASIAPAVSEAEEEHLDRTVRIVTRLENPSGILKSGMTGHAKIHCGERRIADLVTRRFARYLRVEFWSWW